MTGGSQAVQDRVGETFGSGRHLGRLRNAIVIRIDSELEPAVDRIGRGKVAGPTARERAGAIFYERLAGNSGR